MLVCVLVRDQSFVGKVWRNFSASLGATVQQKKMKNEHAVSL